MLENVYIGKDCYVAEDVIVEPFAVISNGSIIHRGAKIGSFSYISNSSIGEGSEVLASFVIDCKVGKNNKIGPLAHLHNSRIKDLCQVGNYVEIKNSEFNNSSKAKHLVYIGDAKVGERCNFGCGSITCNYNGISKNKLEIEDDVFIGSNVNLIAPLRVGKSSYIAAGSTIKENVEPFSYLKEVKKLEVKKNKIAKNV